MAMENKVIGKMNNYENVFLCNTRFKLNRNGEIEQKKYKSFYKRINEFTIHHNDLNNEERLRNKSFLGIAQHLYDKSDNFKSSFSFEAFLSLPKCKKMINDIYESNKCDLNKSKKTSNKRVRKDSVKRSIDTIYDVCKNNVFKSFITLTLNPASSDVKVNDITDNNECYMLLANWLKQCRKVDPNFMYIGVYERQRNGSIHYHLLSSWECGSEFIPFKPIKRNRRKSKEGYQIINYPEIYGWNFNHGLYKKLSNGDEVPVGEYLNKNDNVIEIVKGRKHHKNLGFCSVEPYDSTKETYITKELCNYISKDFDINSKGGRRIYLSRNCKKSVSIYAYVDENDVVNKLNVVNDETGEVASFGLLPKQFKTYSYLNKYDKSAIFIARYKVDDFNRYINVLEKYLFRYLSKALYIDYINKKLNELRRENYERNFNC